MRYLALACSFDSTIASDGHVEPATAAALRRLVASGRHLILISRRPLPDLLADLPVDLFVMVVAEYGAVLYHPDIDTVKRLAPRLNEKLLTALRGRGTEPLAVGESTFTVAAEDAHRVHEAVAATGAEVNLVLDKELLVVTPGGVDKAIGLRAALDALELSPHNVVAIGDADSDLEYIQMCEASIAVANAPKTLRDQVDHVVGADEGAGVAELVDALVADDLGSLAMRRHRRIVVGHDNNGAEVEIPVHGVNVVVAGPSGTGKSTLVTGLLEHIVEQGYQFCALDPEADHEKFPDADHIGDRHHPPTPDDVMTALAQPHRSVVVNLLGIRLEQLPTFFRRLLRRLQELRTRTGRPHWVLLDEANHSLPLPAEKDAFHIPRWMDGLILAAVNAEHIAPDALSLADCIIAFGEPASVLERYAEAIGEPTPSTQSGSLDVGQAVLWRRSTGLADQMQAIRGDAERRPHIRRWSEAPLIDSKAFRFRGPDQRLNLAAPTLSGFLDIAGGVDDETWQHHLLQGDYSSWLRDAIHDDDLATAVADIEARGFDPDESRARIAAVFHDWYRS